MVSKLLARKHSFQNEAPRRKRMGYLKIIIKDKIGEVWGE